MSVVWANRLVHRDQDPPRERVYGPDLFRGVFEAGQDVGLKHYLLGSTPEVLESLVASLRVGLPAGHRRRRREPAVPRAEPRGARGPARADRGVRGGDRLGRAGHPQAGRRVRATGRRDGQGLRRGRRSLRLRGRDQGTGSGLDAAQRPGVDPPAGHRAADGCGGATCSATRGSSGRRCASGQRSARHRDAERLLDEGGDAGAALGVPRESAARCGTQVVAVGWCQASDLLGSAARTVPVDD